MIGTKFKTENNEKTGHVTLTTSIMSLSSKAKHLI